MISSHKLVLLAGIMYSMINHQANSASCVTASETSVPDSCSQAIETYLGANQTQSKQFMESFSNIYQGDGESACSTTQFLTGLLVGRKFQSADADIKALVTETIAQQYKTMDKYMSSDSPPQPAQELEAVMRELKDTVLQADGGNWQPAIASCYWINAPLGIAHTFTLQRESATSFRVWQSFVAQYDLYAWMSQKLEDRLRLNMEETNEYAGQLDRAKMSGFIAKLEQFASGLLPWSESERLHKELHWSPIGVSSNKSEVFNLGCDFAKGYSTDEDCKTGLDNIRQKF